MERVLLVSNAFAGSVSARTKEVIVKALSADCKLEAVDTTHRSHAIELSGSAAADGFHCVLAFGGDGTINEVAQGLVGTDVALGVLPGGSTNVMARSLGIPTDPVEATATVGAALRANRRRRIGVGKVDERYFLFSTGMGLDAEVVHQWETHPEWRGPNQDWRYLRAALKAGATQYRAADPTITLQLEGEEPARVLLAVCCNGRPFTYFRRWPVDVAPLASLDDRLDVYALERIRAVMIPRIAWALLVSRSHVRWKKSLYRHDVQGVRLTADGPLPVQVDGDYIGQRESADITHIPNALDLLI